MHTIVTIFGILLRFVGMFIGVGGVAGFVLALLPPDANYPSPPLWWSALLFVGGMVVVGISMVMAGWGFNRMGHIGKRVLFAGFVIPMGLYLFYAGVGVTGFFYVVPQLDPLHIFAYVQPHWIGYLLGFAGGMMAYWAFSITRAPRQYVNSLGVG